MINLMAEYKCKDYKKCANCKARGSEVCSLRKKKLKIDKTIDTKR